MAARKRRAAVRRDEGKGQPVSRRDEELVLMPPGPGQDNRSADLVDHLLDGPADLDGSVGFETEDEERRCWEVNRAMILSLRSDLAPGDASYPAGNRPWAWWKYDSDAKPRWVALWEFVSRWQRWQWDFLLEHKLLEPEERPAAIAICAKRLEIVEMTQAHRKGDPVAQRRYRAIRKKYLLAAEAG